MTSPPSLTTSYGNSLRSSSFTSCLPSIGSDDDGTRSGGNGGGNANFGSGGARNRGGTKIAPSTTSFLQKLTINTIANAIEEDDDRPSLRTVATVSAALDRNERGRCHDFCVLVGNSLMSFDSVTSFRRGDHPAVSFFLEMCVCVCVCLEFMFVYALYLLCVFCVICVFVWDRSIRIHCLVFVL